jgi:hypothetical protein
LILFAYATVLRLPSEEIEQCGKRLAHETEADPEDHVTGDFPADTFDFLDYIGQEYKRNLEHHACESDA